MCWWRVEHETEALVQEYAEEAGEEIRPASA
jgi:hypothetical protein